MTQEERDGRCLEFILGIKYTTKSVIGSPKPDPTTVTYTFQTLGVANSTDTLNLVRKK